MISLTNEMRCNIMLNVNDQNPNNVYPGIAPVTPPVGVESTAPAAEKVDSQTISTISKSEQEAQALVYNSANPALIPPTVDLGNFSELYGSDSSKALAISGSAKDAGIQFAMAAEQKNHDIIMKILDGWLDNIQKLKKEYEDKINSPQYQQWIKTQSADYTANLNLTNAVTSTPEYQAWALSQITPNPAQVLQPAFSPKEALNVGVINSLDNYVKNTNPADSTNAITAGFVVASAILAVGAVGNPVVDPVQSNIATDPLKDQWAAVSPLVPSNMAAELGLIGSLFTVGIIYQATVANIAEKAGTGNKPHKLDFAQAFAEKMLTLTGSPQFNLFVQGALVNKMNGSEALTDARKAELASLVKIVMLTSALGAYYKIEAGKNTEQEFLSMIRGDPSLGDIVFPAGDVRAKLVQAIRKELNNLTDPAERTRILEAIGEYMGKDPKVDALTDPQSVFEGLLDTTPYGERITKEHV